MDEKSYRIRLGVARSVLGSAVVALVLAHFWPLNDRSPSGVPFYLIDLWKEMVDQFVRGIRNLEGSGAARVGMVATMCFVAAFLVAAPFLAGFFSRARALLWVVRILAAGLIGEIFYNDGSHLPTEPAGSIILLSSLCLTTLGLFLVPKFPKPVLSGPPVEAR